MFSFLEIPLEENQHSLGIAPKCFFPHVAIPRAPLNNSAVRLTPVISPFKVGLMKWGNPSVADLINCPDRSDLISSHHGRIVQKANRSRSRRSGSLGEGRVNAKSISSAYRPVCNVANFDERFDKIFRASLESEAFQNLFALIPLRHSNLAGYRVVL